jgi:hypothetical protein
MRILKRTIPHDESDRFMEVEAVDRDKDI